MIQIIENPPQLLVDGESVAQTSSTSREGGPIFYIRRAENLRRFLTKPIGELPQRVEIRLSGRAGFDDQLVFVPSIRVTEFIELAIALRFRAARWKKPWSIEEFVTQFSDVASQQANWVIETRRFDVDMRQRFSVYIRVEDTTLAIGILIDDACRKILDVAQETQAHLVSSVQKDAVVAFFDFPAAVKAPCEQYLLYFIEFLRDMGVEAEGDLSHDAGRVLFSVTPKSGSDALAKIKEALAIYLSLPEARNLTGSQELMDTPRIQQLLANVQHLKGQLHLAVATIQLKEATIAAQNDALHVLRGAIMQDSIRALESETDNSEDEEIAGGLVVIQKYKGKGFSIDLPEILRHLKSWFAGEGPQPVIDVESSVKREDTM